MTSVEVKEEKEEKERKEKKRSTGGVGKHRQGTQTFVWNDLSDRFLMEREKIHIKNYIKKGGLKLIHRRDRIYPIMRPSGGKKRVGSYSDVIPDIILLKEFFFLLFYFLFLSFSLPFLSFRPFFYDSRKHDSSMVSWPVRHGVFNHSSSLFGSDNQRV